MWVLGVIKSRSSGSTAIFYAQAIFPAYFQPLACHLKSFLERFVPEHSQSLELDPSTV